MYDWDKFRNDHPHFGCILRFVVTLSTCICKFHGSKCMRNSSQWPSAPGQHLAQKSTGAECTAKKTSSTPTLNSAQY